MGFLREIVKAVTVWPFYFPREGKKGEEKIEGEGKRELQGRHQRVGRDTDEGFVSRQRPEREDDERERTKGRRKKTLF